MLNIKCFIFQHIVQVRLNICPCCQQACECPMQRTMLAAVQATDEQLIAPRYLMQISAFSSSAQKDDSYWGPSSDCMALCSLWDDFNSNVAILNVYKRRHSDVIVIKLTAGTQN